MKKSLITKLFAFSLTTIMTTMVIGCSNVYATNLGQENPTIDEILESEEKILKFDVATKEYTEVDMDELREVVSKQSNSNDAIINSIGSYRPKHSPAVIRQNSENVRSDISLLLNTSVTRVVNTSTWPNIITCRIHAISSKTGENRYGTGMLVGPKVLLTAAHCVCDMKDAGNWLDNGIVFPGYNETAGAIYYGDSSGYYTIYTSNNWYKNGKFNEDYDWAICVLDKDLGNMVGYNGMSSYGSNSSLMGMGVTCLGYPADSRYGFYADGGDQYKSTGNIVVVSNYMINYDGTTYEGFSGGPIMRNSDDSVIAVVHGSDNSGRTRGVRVTSEMINLVNTLREQ